MPIQRRQCWEATSAVQNRKTVSFPRLLPSTHALTLDRLPRARRPGELPGPSVNPPEHAHSSLVIQEMFRSGELEDPPGRWPRPHQDQPFPARLRALGSAEYRVKTR